MKRRGSALVYVIIVVFSITSVVLIGAKMSSAAENEFQSSVKDAQFKAMADGAVAQIVSDSYKETMATGVRNVAFTNGNVSVNATTHDTMTRAYKLVISGTVGERSFSTTKVVGKREKPNPAYYGLWVRDNYSDALLATNVNGSVYFNGSATVSGAWNVSDDLLTRGASVLSLGSTVSGNHLTNVRAQTEPSLDPNAYQTQASVNLPANNQGDFTFAGVDAQGKYPVHYRGTNFTMNGGTISGRGTLFVKGNITINGNYNYADANSRILIIAEGKIIVGLLATQVVGTMIAKDDFNLSPVTLNVVRGNICAFKQFNRLSTALTITQDSTFVDNAVERVNHRLPGFFP